MLPNRRVLMLMSLPFVSIARGVTGTIENFEIDIQGVKRGELEPYEERANKLWRNYYSSSVNDFEEAERNFEDDVPIVKEIIEKSSDYGLVVIDAALESFPLSWFLRKRDRYNFSPLSNIIIIDSDPEVGEVRKYLSQHGEYSLAMDYVGGWQEHGKLEESLIKSYEALKEHQTEG